MATDGQRLKGGGVLPRDGSTDSAKSGGGLLGREAELASLSALLEGSEHGGGAIAWVEGEAGIGKTSLTGAAAEIARERGFGVLAAGAQELDSHRPFGVIADCLGVERRSSDERRAAIARTLSMTPSTTPDTPVDGGRLEFAMAEELLGLVEEACARSPLVLILDDLQWADPSSLMFLGRLARELAGLPLVVVGAARPLPRRAELERLIVATVSRGAGRVTLDPLDEAVCTRLAAELARGEPGPRLSEHVRACGGNPLFVAELIGALETEGSIELDSEGGAEVAPGEVPPTLALTVLARLSFLTSEVVEVLGLASVLGSSFSVADLSLLSGRPAAALWGPLREAMAAGVLEQRGDRLAFRHDVVREALYGDLPRPVRSGLHLDVGRALAASGSPPGIVAEHLVRGARRGDREAVEWLERAAREAAPRGAQAAAELLEAALEVAEPDDLSRGRLTAELALNLVAARRHEEGEELCRRALEDGLHPELEGVLRLCLAHSLLGRGRLVETLAEAKRAEESSGVSDAERAAAAAWAPLAPLFLRDLDAATTASERALRAGEQAGVAGVRTKALTYLGLVAGFRGEFAEQERCMARSAALAQGDGTRDAHEAIPHLMLAMALTDSDRVEEAGRALATARRTYARLGMEVALLWSHLFVGYVLFWRGDWDDALVELETATGLADQAGGGWQVDVLAASALIQARRDRLETAREHVAEARRHLEAGGIEWRIGAVTWAEGLVHDGAGHSERALELVWGAWESATAAGTVCEHRTFAPDLARMLAAVGDHERGEQVASAVEALAARNPGLVSLEALALRCRALAEGDVEGLLRAAESYRPTRRPHERALACEDAAVALAGAGRFDEVDALADEALGLYGTLGAERDIARVQGRLRAAGVRRARRGARTRAASGWSSLTPSELRVAELAAAGLSNREIAERLVLSRHTVVTHVSHVLAKLELRSRLELAARAARRESDG